MSFQSLSETSAVLSFFDNITDGRISDAAYVTYKELAKEDTTTMETFISVVSSILHKPWIGSIIGSCLVSLSGVFPLLFIHVGDDNTQKGGVGGQSLKVLLSFAVGGLLGDVFLHLLPEAWALQRQLSDGNPSLFCGAWVLIGLLLFIIVEKVFSCPNPYAAVDADKLDDLAGDNNNQEDKAVARASHQQVAGYLNLIANSIDNYTHGLAVGASFLLSPRVGALTTFAILVHEVPHEIGDFAILLRAGFSRWDAARAQLLTGTAGMVGALTAVCCSGAGSAIEAKTSWILPFTAGGFLHISLVTVLPELLQEEDPRESVKQLVSLVSGVVVMAVLTSITEG